MKKFIAMMIILVTLVTGNAFAKEGTFYTLEFVDDFEFKDDDRLLAYGYEYDDGSDDMYIDICDVATIMIFEHADGECGVEITEYDATTGDGEVVFYKDGYTLDEFNQDEELHSKIITYIYAILLMN